MNDKQRRRIIIAKMAARGKNFSDVARGLKVSRQFVSQVWRGARKNRAVRSEIARAAGVDVVDIFDE